MSLDRHAVVVVNPAEIAEHLVTGERRRFAGDALHHVAVPAQCIDIEAEHGEVRPIEMPSKPAAGECHADAVAAALPQRPGRRLDARGQVVLGMPRTLAAELSESFDVIERDRGFAERFVFGVDRLHAGEMRIA